MALGTTTLTYVDCYDLKNDNTWSSRSARGDYGVLIGTTNGATTKQIVQYSFTLPSSFNSNKVSSVDTLGFYIGTRTDGTNGTSYSYGYGDASNDSGVNDWAVRFFVTSSSSMTWTQAKGSGSGGINYEDLNKGRQVPMSSKNKSIGKLDPDQFSVSNLKANTKYYLYIYIPDCPTGQQRLWGGGRNGTLVFNYVSYTPCNAPTSVYIGRDENPSTATKEFFKPGTNTFYISWKGASAGTANAIKDYVVYYNIGKAPTTSSKSTGSVTGTSTSITISDSTRGRKLYFAVVARGAAGSAYNSSMSDSVVGIINELPSAPTIKYKVDNTGSVYDTNLTVKSTAGTLYLEVAKKGKEYTDYSCKPGTKTSSDLWRDGVITDNIFYTIKQGTNETSNFDSEATMWNISSKPNLTLSIGTQEGQKTYFNFATRDGLETGPIKTIVITKNIKPYFKATPKNNIEFNYSDGGAFDIGYTLHPQIDISEANKDGLTYKYQLERVIDGAYHGDKFDNLTEIIPITDLPMGINDYNYSITVTGSDDLESYSIILDSDIWIVPGIPAVYASNGKGDKDIEEAKYVYNEKTYYYFKDWVTLKHQQNTRIAYVSVDKDSQLYTTEESDSKLTQYFNYNVSSLDYTSAENKVNDVGLYNPTLTFYDSNKNTLGSKTLNKTMKKIGLLSESSVLTSTTYEFHPYTYDSTVTWNLTLTRFEFNSDIDYAFYGLKPQIEAEVWFDVESADPTKLIKWNLDFQEENSENSEGDPKFIWNGWLNDLYAIIPYQNADELLEPPLCLSIKDVFSTEDNVSYFYFLQNGNYTSKLLLDKKIKLEYREKPFINMIQTHDGDKKDLEITSSSLNNSEKEYLKEKSDFKLRVGAFFYNERPKLRLIIERKYDDPQFEDERFTHEREMIWDFATSPSPLASHNKPVLFYWDDNQLPQDEGYARIIEELLAVKGDYTVTVSIELFSDAYTDIEKKYTLCEEIRKFNVKRHINPNIVIENTEYIPPIKDENGVIITDPKVVFNYVSEENDFGLDTNLTKKAITANLYYRIPTQSENVFKDTRNDENLWYEKIEIDGEETENLLEFKLDMENSPAGFIQLEVITTLTDINDGSITTKTARSNEIAVYNISPTVAYRQNHLGINTNKLNLTSDKEPDGIVCIAEAGNRKFIYFNTIGGIKKINIITGEMDGFVLEGGTW